MILFLRVCLFIAIVIIFFLLSLCPSSQMLICMFLFKFSRNGVRQKRKEIVSELGQQETVLWLRKEMS